MPSIVYLNGSFVAQDSANLSTMDRGFTLSDGLFETMVASDDRIFRLNDHLDRLQRGAAILWIQLPRVDELIHVIGETSRLNGFPYSIVRLTVTRGVDSGRGLNVTRDVPPSVVVRVTPWHGLSDQLTQGRRMVFSNIRRNDLSPLTTVKSLSYVESVVARLEAHSVGADDALLLNTKGFLSGATSSNVFAVIEGELITPSENEGILPGIARRTVLEEAIHLGIIAKELPLTQEAITNANEVFLTNVVTGIVPVISLSGSEIGSGKPGVITDNLANAYRERVLSEIS